ncbi:MAG TPA: cytochrome c3 family protein [Caldilineaceae bacterium]|nr:cytochrome c3 family protein [Caldilineaceae bacterium]
MSQLFHPSANTFARVTIFGALFVLVGLAGIGLAIARSPYQTQVNVVQPQPVPFSHEHHVNGLGIDCRYCHTSVEESSFAGIPPTHTCMTCHSQIWNDSPVLAPVRASYRTGEPLVWNRVHNLPDYVYFNHGIHIQKGIGCTNCHGPVDTMPMMYKAEPMTMEWCLNCHRAPEEQIRPREEVFNMDYEPPLDQLALGRELVAQYHIPTERLTDCYVCHR